MTGTATRFDYAVAGVIILNTGLLVVPLLDHTHAKAVDTVETGCLLFFVYELWVRGRTMGWRGFSRSWWCRFDTAVIALSLLPVLIEMMETMQLGSPVMASMVSGLRVARIARFARLLHVGRHVSGLRLLRLVPAMARR